MKKPIKILGRENEQMLYFKDLFIIDKPSFLKGSSRCPTDIFNVPSVHRGSDAKAYEWDSLKRLTFCKVYTQLLRKAFYRDNSALKRL
jgi:hypothetical protein